jgi:hypothetical protein
MVQAVVVVVMGAAEDEIPATVGTPTAIIGAVVRATQIRSPRDIRAGEIGAFAAAEE